MRSPATGAIMERDEHGNLLIRIPRQLVERFEENLIAVAIERLLGPVEEETRGEVEWEGDPLLTLIGRFESDATDGSIHHDEHIYLDPV
jgi:hypothetical protein